MTGPPVLETPAERYRRLYGGGVDTTRVALSPAAEAYRQRFSASPSPGAPEPEAPPAPAQRERPRGLMRALRFAEKLGQTLNPFQDEIAGAVSAVGALVPGGRSPREAYVQDRDASRASTAQYGSVDPLGNVAATGLGIAGTLAAGPLRAGAKALPVIARGLPGAGRAAAIGAGKAAAYAAPYSFGAAEGTPGEQLRQTAVGTGVAGGTGALFGPLANRMARRNPARGSLPNAAKIGGTDVPEAAARRATLDPAVRDLVPPIVHLDPSEAKIARRTFRTREGASLGRTAEQRLNALDRQRRLVGDAKEALVTSPTPVTDPGVLTVLRNARQTPAFDDIVKATVDDLASAGKVVGPVTTPFRGTIGAAIAAGIPEADIIAKHGNPALLQNLLSHPANRARAMSLAVPDGLEQTVEHPYTVEFFDLLQKTARKVLKADYDAGGSAATSFIDRTNKQLSAGVRQAVPAYDDLQRQYGQLKTVLKTGKKRLRASYDKDAPIGRRYEIDAGPEAPGMASTPAARGMATPETRGGRLAARVALIREVPQYFARKAERKATEELLSVGSKADQVFARLLSGTPGRKVPAGTWRVPGLFGVPKEENP